MFPKLSTLLLIFFASYLVVFARPVDNNHIFLQTIPWTPMRSFNQSTDLHNIRDNLCSKRAEFC